MASYRLQGGMKHPLVVLPPQMLSDYYGERCRFLCGFQKSSGNLRMRKTDLYLLEYIQTEMSQSQIMPQMIQYTVFYDASGHKEAVHEEMPSQTT